MSRVKKIMIVDDDNIHNYLFSKRIKNSGFTNEVIEFESGRDALKYLINCDQNQLPEIIFLDIMMPGFDGWDFLREYENIKKDLPKDITIFMLSSSIHPRDIKQAKENPYVSEYIKKPMMEDELFLLQDRFFN